MKILLLLYLALSYCHAVRQKRQLSIDDLIHRALNLVKPIFDTSQPLQNDAMINRQFNEPSVQEGMRQESVLGASRSALSDLPFCKGNSRLCQFISCQAENFKQDQNFANLNLAAQVLGDKKLRKAVSSNPEAIGAVCDDQGLSEDQCKLFSKGFQLIDKFITTVEGPEPIPAEPASKTELHATSQIPQRDEIQEDEPVPIGKSSSRAFGSKTWSSHPDQLPTRMDETKNDLVASFTPLPNILPVKEIHSGYMGPPGHFVHPTMPTAPPLAFPTLPTFPPLDMKGILALQPLKIPGLHIEKPFLQFSQDQEDYQYIKESNNEIKIQKREARVDEDVVDVEGVDRVKRDYYDDLHQARRNLGFGQPIKPVKEESAKVGSTDDYYAQTAADDPPQKSQSKTNPTMRDCMTIFG